MLLTSRRASWETSLGIATLALDVLPRPESIALLRQFRPDLTVVDQDLEAIAAELGDLPLALHLAGSFLARYRHVMTPEEYLTQLRQPDLLAHRSLQGWRLTQDLSPTRHEQHVARTFALSYDQLDPADATDSYALALLARAVCFAPGQPILRDLLLATVAGAAKALEIALQAEDALRRLLDLGLLEPEATGTVRLHRLLAVFVRAVVQDAAAQMAVELALLAEANRLNRTGYPGPLLTLQPHLRAVTEAARLREDVQAARLETMLGDSLRLLGDYASAQPAYERALVFHEQLSGPHHREVAWSLYNLANLYRDRERYGEAEPLYQRALALHEQLSGPNHPNVARTLNSLALLYYYQGRYSEAEPLYQRVLALDEQLSGPDHPDGAMTLNNLAILYRAQGRYREAEQLHQRVLAIRERVLSIDHPDFTMSLNNLANLYRDQGRYGEAEPLYQRALATRERVLGPDHPRVAQSLNNLADCYWIQGRYGEAEPLYRRAVTIWEHGLGPDHSNVLVTSGKLMLIYWSQGRYAEAEPFYQRVLAFCEQGLWPIYSYMAATRKVAASMPLRYRIRVCVVVMRMAPAILWNATRAWLSGTHAAR